MFLQEWKLHNQLMMTPSYDNNNSSRWKIRKMNFFPYCKCHTYSLECYEQIFYYFSQSFFLHSCTHTPNLSHFQHTISNIPTIFLSLCHTNTSLNPLTPISLTHKYTLIHSVTKSWNKSCPNLTKVAQKISRSNFDSKNIFCQNNPKGPS